MAHARARLGIVGAGRWGENLLRTFGALEGCEIGAVCDSNPARLESALIPEKAARSTDFHSLLADPSLAAVAIATPPRLHAIQAVSALAAGKHVFVEKPMATCHRDAQHIREEAARSGRVFMVGHLLRYHPAIVEMKRLIDKGVLGTIHHARAFRLGPAGSRSDDGPWWALAPHDLSLVRHLLDAEVVAIGARERRFADGGSEVRARARLTVGSAEFVVSTAHPRKLRRLVLEGTRDLAVFDDSLPRATLTVGARNVTLSERTPLECEAEHFLAAVLGGGRVATDAEEGCRVVAALEAGALSMARHGASVEVPSAPIASRRAAPLDDVEASVTESG